MSSEKVLALQAREIALVGLITIAEAAPEELDVA
jgi:hypothetical protein